MCNISYQQSKRVIIGICLSGNVGGGETRYSIISASSPVCIDEERIS
jgi:hypothetical protein